MKYFIYFLVQVIISIAINRKINFKYLLSQIN